MTIDGMLNDEDGVKFEYRKCLGITIYINGGQDPFSVAPEHEYLIRVDFVQQIRCNTHQIIHERYKKRGLTDEQKR